MKKRWLAIGIERLSIHWDTGLVFWIKGRSSHRPQHPPGRDSTKYGRGREFKIQFGISNAGG